MKSAAMFIIPGSSRLKGSMTLHSNTCFERGAPVTISLSRPSSDETFMKFLCSFLLFHQYTVFYSNKL